MPLKRDPSLIPLSHDHHHGLLRVFEIRQALRGGDDAPLARQRVITRAFYVEDLRPHFRAEEEVLVPVLRDHAAVDEAEIERLLDDHRRLGELLDDLDSRTTALADLADLLERHIRREEREIFAAYQERVPAAHRAAVEAGLRRILNRPVDPL